MSNNLEAPRGANNPISTMTALDGTPIPTAHADIDNLLVPALADWVRPETNVPSDSSRTPVYPSFYELPRTLILLSENEAVEYHRALRRSAIDMDAAIANMRGNPLPYVEKIYEAIIDTTEAQDDKKSRAYTKMTKAYAYGPYYRPKIVVAVCWKVVSFLIDGVVGSFLESNSDLQMKETTDADDNLTLNDRHRLVCIALRREKSIVEDIMSGDDRKLHNFLFAPVAYCKLKELHRMDNKLKDVSKKKGASASGPSSSPVAESGSLSASRLYPDFDEIPLSEHFDSIDSALAFLRRTQPRLLPENDPHFALLASNKLYLVIKLYEAFRCVADVQNVPNSPSYKRFVASGNDAPNGRHFSPAAVMSTCWKTVTFFLDGVERGLLIPMREELKKHSTLFINNKAVGASSGVRRFASMCEVLRREKSVCWLLLTNGPGLDEFVFEPYAFGALCSGEENRTVPPPVLTDYGSSATRPKRKTRAPTRFDNSLEPRKATGRNPAAATATSSGFSGDTVVNVGAPVFRRDPTPPPAFNFAGAGMAAPRFDLADAHPAPVLDPAFGPDDMTLDGNAPGYIPPDLLLDNNNDTTLSPHHDADYDELMLMRAMNGDLPDALDMWDGSGRFAATPTTAAPTMMDEQMDMTEDKAIREFTGLNELVDEEGMVATGLGEDYSSFGFEWELSDA